MEVSATFFKNIYDNKTHKRFDFEDFSKFEEFLYKLSRRKLKSKKDAALMSPATYIEGTTRANKNVVNWAGWAAIDVDDHEFKGDLKNELASTHGKWHYVCYSTASSRDSLPKFRLCFPLRKRVEPDKIRHFWFALNKEFGSLGDEQAKDLSRMYYIPGTYNDAFNFIFTNNGDFLDPQEIMDRHPYTEKKTGSFLDRLPDEIQKQIVEHRKKKMDNTSIYWSGYEDCPFVNKNMIRDFKNIAHVDNSGRYAMIYKIMVSIASNAVDRRYPISVYEIVELVRQLDADTARRYENRPLNVEADRAIEYAYRNV